MLSPAYYKAGVTAGSEFTEIWFHGEGTPHSRRESLCVEATRYADGTGWIRRYVQLEDGRLPGNGVTEILMGRIEIRGRCC